MHKIIDTLAYDDQKPGTSGLRKKTQVFMQKNYLANYIQAVFNSLPELQGGTLVLGGDGRYYNDKAIQIIIKIAIANNVKKIIIGQNGLLSTPAASNIIRKYCADGGFILSASHNPGGKLGDVGVKYNIKSGSAAPSKICDKFFEESKKITSYKYYDVEDIDLSKICNFVINETTIKIIDPVKDYVELMEQIFDFELIKSALTDKISFKFDAMNAVTGPYAQEIFVNKLGVLQKNILRAQPKIDFGNIHPDPQLKYLEDLLLGSDKITLSAACDGDGDRNLLLANGDLVNPCDSLAMMIEYGDFIAYYSGKIKGVARSIPTSRAVDKVSKAKNISFFATPTGWKYFGNLLDAGLISICGEESYGTGSAHVREKDGIWAILFWLNVMAKTKKSLYELREDFWQKYGRCYFARFDVENLAKEEGESIMNSLSKLAQSPQDLQQNYPAIKQAQNIEYIDPVDKTVTKNVATEFIFNDDARLIFRLSGTGTHGATLRIYADKFDKQGLDPEKLLFPYTKVFSIFYNIPL